MTEQPIAFVFPGQGSQMIGMGKELAEEYLCARQLYEYANQILGFPISKLSWEGPEEELNDTINTQPALLVHAVAVLRVIEEHYPYFLPTCVAGHSMGELSALVASQALPFDSALQLARRRGELMKLAGNLNPGGMAAILGLDIPTLELICQQASNAEEVVQIANDNCPGQVVISGHKSALEYAITLANQAGARKTKPLAVSIAAHSPLMQSAQNEFNLAIQTAQISSPKVPLIGNVTARSLETADAVRQDLRMQLTSRVRWTESIQGMIKLGVRTFVEIGTGNVLSGLIKRIDREVSQFTLGNPADFEKLNELTV